MMNGLVYATRTPLPDPGTAPLAALGLKVRQHAFDTAPTRDELEAEFVNADAVIVTTADAIDAELIEKSKTLKIIATVAVGHDNIDKDAAKARGIVIANTPNVLTEATADLGWSLMLSVARRVVEGDAYVRAGKFEGISMARSLGHDVFGKTIGIIGMGSIGTAVARRAQGFGMRVMFTSRTLKPELEAELGAEQSTVADALQQSDFVVITAPLTEETRHLIDGNAIALMKPTSYLINIGRGPIVDECALVEALRQRRIAGAALDVYEFEPKLADGLIGLDNVVLTPHIGSATVETRGTMMRLCCDNIIAVLSGKPALTPV